MKAHRPHGIGPTTWEANILKIRAFEMMLVLFYMEDLKRFVIRSIQVTDQMRGVNRLDIDKSKSNEGKKVDRACLALVSEGVISQAESDELKQLVDYRNLIGHQIHDLTVDIGIYSDLTLFKPIPAYDYLAAKRAEKLRQKVSEGMAKKFVISGSFSSLAFEVAEKTYVAEIERLKRRVNKSITQSNKVISETNSVIRAIPRSVMESAQPDHPKNTKTNGTLSKHGVNCIFQLFEAQATPLAVAYMMRISHRAAMNWYKKWKPSKV